MKYSCFECQMLVKYSGSKDRYGVPQEPDDYECKGEPTEEEIDKYFCDGQEWSSDEEGCSCFKQIDWSKYIDD